MATAFEAISPDHLMGVVGIDEGCWRRESLKGAEAWSDGSNGCVVQVSAQAQSDSKKGTTYYYYCLADDDQNQRFDDESIVNSIRSVTAADQAANDTSLWTASASIAELLLFIDCCYNFNYYRSCRSYQQRPHCRHSSSKSLIAYPYNLNLTEANWIGLLPTKPALSLVFREEG